MYHKEGDVFTEHFVEVRTGIPLKYPWATFTESLSTGFNLKIPDSTFGLAKKDIIVKRQNCKVTCTL